jgi:uncharacterized protein (TIGR02246 family)
MKGRVSVVAALLLLAACAPKETAPAHDAAADKAAVDKLRSDYQTALNAGNWAGMKALYDADAMVMQNGQPTAKGLDAIDAMNNAMATQMTGMNINIKPEKTEISGDLAYDRGTYTMKMTPKGGVEMTEEGRYVVVLKRQADGSFKIVEEIGNLPTAPMPMPAPKKD